MTTKISLSTPAVQNLIANDENFELDLKRAIIAEVSKKLLLKDVNAVVEQISPTIYQEIANQTKLHDDIQRELDNQLKALAQKTSYYSKEFHPTKSTKERLDKAFRPVVDSYLRQIENDSIKSLNIKAKEVKEDIYKDIDEKIENRLNMSIEKHINDEVDKRVRVKLSELLRNLNEET